MNIWTIGHSTRTLAEFTGLLHWADIEVLVDIRSLPGSTKFPHFNKERLAASLDYTHILDLGGRRSTRRDSLNTRWNNPSFRGYADYMETPAFRDGVARLTEIAQTKRVAYMCSEAYHMQCHRSMLSDYLTAQGWNVQHINGYRLYEHNYTQPARIVNGELTYHEPATIS